MVVSSMEIVGQARKVLAELHRLQGDNSAWRLAPAPFLEVACREGGIETAEIPPLLAKLARPGYENAHRCVQALAAEFASNPRRHHAAGVHPAAFNADARDELAACGVTVRQASALAAWLATQGGTLNAGAWGGRSPERSWITAEIGRLQAELAELNGEGERSLTLADLHLVHVGDRDDATLYKVTVAGTAVAAGPKIWVGGPGPDGHCPAVGLMPRPWAGA
jgi:hypothetical protein